MFQAGEDGEKRVVDAAAAAAAGKEKFRTRALQFENCHAIPSPFTPTVSMFAGVAWERQAWQGSYRICVNSTTAMH